MVFYHTQSHDKFRTTFETSLIFRIAKTPLENATAFCASSTTPGDQI